MHCKKHLRLPKRQLQLQRGRQGGCMIKEKALFYAESLKCPDFKASDAWMQKWKKW